MNNAINMLPCPMCGCTSINVKNEQPTDNSGGYFIECPDCGISTSLRYACGDDPIPLLAEQWNRRATAQCLHQIAEPQADELFDEREGFVNWLHGTYPLSYTIIHAADLWFHKHVAALAWKARAAISAAQHQQELAAYRFTVENREARIAELESQLEAIGAGGVEPLRKPAAAPQAVQAAVPLFWVRLLRDGLYEGPVHNNSVGGKMLRDEKPGEWHPLYLHAAPAHPAEGVPASVIAGAVFDFAGYLTTLPHKEAIHCSEAHEAAPMVEAITEWCKRRNLTTDGAKVETWRDHLAEAPAHPAEGVPAQSYVADFFREKGFYPSLAQAFAAGVAHAAAMPAQSVDEIMELADEYAGAQACAVTATSTEDADTTKERNALLSAIRAALAATQPAAQGMDAEIQQAVEAERERICAAIKAEDDHCVDQGDYMLDSNDCIEIVRGKWVRPDYSLDAAQAKQGGAA